MKVFNPDKAAAALLESMIGGDKAAAEKYGVTVRTMQEWRSRLSTDTAFQAVYATKKAAFDAAWCDEAPAALRAGIGFLRKSADEAAKNPVSLRDPLLIHALAGAFKLVAGVYVGKQLMDARLADMAQDDLPDYLPDREPARLTAGDAQPENCVDAQVCRD